MQCEQPKSKLRKSTWRWTKTFDLLTSGRIGSFARARFFKECVEPIYESALSILAFCAVCFAFYTLMTCLSGSAEANAVIPELAVRAIIGEAAGEPYIGKVALAEAIRNRGNLNGVYGLKRESFISAQPKWVHEQAKKAWKESANSNHVKGASFWENTKAFGTPYWAKDMKKTATIGSHDFYKAVKHDR